MTAPAAEDRPLPRADLLADTSTVVPGKPFLLAARIQVAPGWHLYWENPGESGLPTRMVPAAPAGFRVGPVRYPGPERFESPGPIVNYGYPGAAILFSEITPPASLPTQPVAFTAHLSWLACKQSCVPGKADLALSLPAHPAAGKSTGPAPMPPTPPISDETRFALAPFAARLPAPLSDLPGAQIGGEPEHRWLRLTGTPKDDGAADAEVFPATGVEVTAAQAGTAPPGANRQFDFRRATDAVGPAPTALGVLRLRNRGDGTVKYYALAAPGKS